MSRPVKGSERGREGKCQLNSVPPPPTRVEKRGERRRAHTHLLGQGVQVREGFESTGFVGEFLEQRRVPYGVDEFVGDLLRESPRRGGKCTRGVTLRLHLSSVL